MLMILKIVLSKNITFELLKRVKTFGSACGRYSKAYKKEPLLFLDQGLIQHIIGLELFTHISTQKSFELLTLLNRFNLIPDHIVYMEAPPIVILERLRTRPRKGHPTELMTDKQVLLFLENSNNVSKRIVSWLKKDFNSNISYLDSSKEIENLTQLLKANVDISEY